METGIITLAHYEARIALYKEQIGTGYIGIGKTLNEAKEAGAVPHGEWEGWVERVTGLTIRQAQKCMQAAREIRDGSELAKLEMSKAIMLLGSGLEEDEREELARKTAEEGGTVKQLREEIERVKAAKQAEVDEAMEAVRQLKVQVVNETGTATVLKQQLKEADKRNYDLTGQLESARELMKAESERAATAAYQRGHDEGRHEGETNANNLITRLHREKSQLETDKYNLQKQLDTVTDDLAAAEEREAKKSRQLEELRSVNQARAMDGARVSAQAFGGTDLTAAVRQFIGAAGVLPQMGSTLCRMPEDEREVIRDNIETVAAWVRGAMAAMGVVDAEGLVS